MKQVKVLIAHSEKDVKEEIRNNIKDTYVVSGHGPNDKENFITTDKIYLLSAGEIFRDVTQDECEGIFLESYPYDCRGYDLDNFTDSVMTRQLDYYENKEVTTCSCTNAPLKEIALEYVPDEQYYWARYMWWLRSVFSDHSFSSGVGNFDDVGHASIFSVQLGSSDEFGVSPAFRIG